MSVNPNLPVHRLVARERAGEVHRREVMMARANARYIRKAANKAAKGPRRARDRNILVTKIEDGRERQYHATKGWRERRA